VGNQEYLRIKLHVHQKTPSAHHLNLVHYWPCWTYFNQILGDYPWEEKTILDFGGSWGNLLRDPFSEVKEQNYWCLDVRPEAVSAGAYAFPQAHWVLYNRWSQQYNPTGLRAAPLPLPPNAFDLVIAHSVFTHTSRSEMVTTVETDLLPLLVNGGACIITLLQTEQLAYFLQKRSPLAMPEQALLCQEAEALSSSFYLLSNRDIQPIDRPLPDDDIKRVVTAFYKTDEILSLWPQLNITLKVIDVNEQCAVIVQKQSNVNSVCQPDNSFCIGLPR
jgi:hypothetical protein